MQFDPNKQMPQPAAGIYRFFVADAFFKTSDSGRVTEDTDTNGNSYVKPKLAVEIPGSEFKWSCRPFLGTHPRFIFKLRHFCECVGLDFASGNIDMQDAVGKEGWGEFVLDKSSYNDLEVVDFLPARKIAELSPANKILYQKAVKAYGENVPAGAAQQEEEDSIPF